MENNATQMSRASYGTLTNITNMIAKDQGELELVHFGTYSAPNATARSGIPHATAFDVMSGWDWLFRFLYFRHTIAAYQSLKALHDTCGTILEYSFGKYHIQSHI